MSTVKLSEWAKIKRVVYKTAWNRFKQGKIPNSYQDEFGTIYVKMVEDRPKIDNAIIYARSSSHDQKQSLLEQQKFLERYASSKNYNIVASYKEIASGMNDERKILSKILLDDSWNVLVVENKDRLTRFGFNYIETLLNKVGKKIDVVNFTDNNKDDLTNDLISIIYSFSARLYGKRKAKRKDQIKKFIEENNEIN